ncbi:antitoxin MazE family protein [Devosia aurantiaca]|uniref:Antitoxin MazE family protein n=1 Tax=Devosia aurantiaca TaxID=2714858 RepID=A0A6M1SJS3_9HYPH|nr:antitoxin MazE family protein [Devosia aurantiaca]NGP17468.1 antitoxin MazE family protein [Devosia aurantiaca]
MSRSARRYTPEEEAAMRAQGLKPVTVWVFDTDRPGFAEECARQSRLLAEADARDPTIDSFMDAANRDMDLPPYEED